MNIKTLDTIILAKGAHGPTEGAMCAMEAVAYIAGEPWSDHPQCVSPVIAAFMRLWNDALPDDDRTRLLRPLLPLVVGTRTTATDEGTRAWMVADWLVRVHTPAWLRLAGLADHAQTLESCASFVDAATVCAEQPKIAAAGAAARAAARDAAGAAAWAAARDAAWAAARDAAGAAARDAAGAAAWAASRDAAWAAAWDAAGAAAWAAKGAAASAALAPTVAALQASAQDLVRAMCAVGRATGRGEDK
jgi:hypothetical protein